MTSSLFVGNIAYGAMEKELRELFETCGEVEEVRFIMDPRKGRFRGFGFITMPKEAADSAIEQLHDAEFQGRQLIVREARRQAMAV